MTDKEIQKLAILLRFDILEMIYAAQFGYIGGSLSALELIATLYFGEIYGKPILKYDPHKPQGCEQDYFILSKAHACPALYAVLAEAGFFHKEELRYFRKSGSLLQAYPFQKIPGIAVSGTLHQGLSIACGLASALKIDRKPYRVYCLLGDGELQDGQVFEAMMSASHYQLDNLCVLIDFNGFQAEGSIREIVNIEPIQDKFESFGFSVIRILDGHNVSDIVRALEKAWKIQRKPVCIIAHTIKGKGLPFMERKSSYHDVKLSEMEIFSARREIEKQLEFF